MRIQINSRLTDAITLQKTQDKKLIYRRDVSGVDDVKWPFKVTEGHPLLCQWTRHIRLPNSTSSNLYLQPFLRYHAYVAYPFHTPTSLQVELEKDVWEYVDMLWCEGAQNTGLSNQKLKSALMCIVWSHHNAGLSQTDRRTDGRTNVMATAQRLVLTNASRTKMCINMTSPDSGFQHCLAVCQRWFNKM